MGVTSKRSDNKFDKVITYPCLMEALCKSVVLLTSPKEGTIVYSIRNSDIGYYSKNWATDGWTPYHGPITLEWN